MKFVKNIFVVMIMAATGVTFAEDVETKPTPGAIAMEALQRCEEAALAIASEQDSSSATQVVNACASERAAVTKMLTTGVSSQEKASLTTELKEASTQHAEETLQVTQTVNEMVEQASNEAPAPTADVQ